MEPRQFRDRHDESGSGRADRQGQDGAHPSYLALDRAALGSMTPEIARHVAECSRCRAHLDGIVDPPPLPASAAEPVRRAARAGRSGGTRSRPAPRRAWLVPLCAAAAAAVILLVVLAARDRPGARLADSSAPSQPRPSASVGDPGYDTAKGGRAVGVYVKRGRQTFLWNGSEPVQPGDAIRLKLVPDGMTQVHVFSEAVPRRAGEGTALTLLHRAVIAPDRDTTLETAWRIDGAGEREVLIVVLSRHPLLPASAQAMARAGRMASDTWVARLVLPKRSPADPSSIARDSWNQDPENEPTP